VQAIPPSKGALLLRLSSSFPGRRPGVGLLVLRAAVGLPAAVEAMRLLGGDGLESAAALAFGIVLAAGGLSVLAGFLTPLAAAAVGLCGGAAGLEWVPTVALAVLNDRLATLLVVAVALAIVLLGPGAYSLDSYLFGRREIIIK
jgi:hypothetical protein